LSDSETLVRVEHVSKKFCKSLKRSLWYGVRDTLHELNPFVPKEEQEATDGNASFQLPELRRDEFWAVRDISFELKRGECLGIIGHNGAGKSTLLKMLNGLIKPDTGRIEMRGCIGALIELGAGFNPILTGRENIYSKGAVLGFTKREMDGKFDAIVDFAEIGDFLDMPVQHYSSGMKVRLGFAVSAQMDPDVLIIDEVLAVGDMAFRMKCLNLIGRLRQSAALILVSHAMPQIARACTSGMVLQDGCVDVGPTSASEAIERHQGSSPTGERITMVTSGFHYCGCSVGGNREGESAVLRLGDPLRVSARIEVEEARQGVFAWAVVWNQEARPVGAVMDDGRANRVSLSEGMNSVEIVVPSLALRNGKYSVSISIKNENNRVTLLRIDNAVDFQVVGAPSTTSDVLFQGEVCVR